MNKKTVLVVAVVLMLLIGIVRLYSLYDAAQNDLHAKIKDDLNRMETLVSNNLSLLDVYYEGDNLVYENIIYNHMVIRDIALENEKLSLFKVNGSIITKSYELLDIKDQYLDEMSRDDKTTKDFMYSYYNKLLEDILALNKDEISVKAITSFLENGSTHIIFE